MIQPSVSSEGFSDSDEVFPKEMTKWNSNDFIDAFASPTEAEGVPGKDPASHQNPICNKDFEQIRPKFNGEVPTTQSGDFPGSSKSLPMGANVYGRF
jgi:hypothetical protein